MPTGYTADVMDGKVTSFPQFALQCARAFIGSMRDVPFDAPIPDKFEPSDYHANALQDAKVLLMKLEAMTESQRTVAAVEANQRQHIAWVEREAQVVAMRARYTAMLKEVRAWRPPTADHIDLKQFMVSQLEDSIAHDCHASDQPKPLSTSEWYSKALERAKWDVAYHSEGHAKETKRAATRTMWVANLRISLAPQADGPSQSVAIS